MPKRKDSAEFDSAAIALPSDRITLGQMRACEPELFTIAALQTEAPATCDAFSTRAWELILAEKAFAAALGRPDPHPNDDRRHIVEELLDEAYRTYSLSAGLHETRRLASAIEQAAARQAGPCHGSRG